MACIKTPVVITANCLRSGEVLYWAIDGRWATSLKEARYFHVLDEAERQLAEVADPSLVIAPYLAEVEVDKAIVASHYREQIRSAGPGVYLSERKTV